jgi:hypothetical protein
MLQVVESMANNYRWRADAEPRGTRAGKKHIPIRLLGTIAGSDAGGERAAAIYNLIGTAKLIGLDPETYLRNVLSRIADHPINRKRSTNAPVRGALSVVKSSNAER